MGARIEDKYEAYKVQVNRRWDQRKANEEEPNRIFARIFDPEEQIPESFKGNRYVLTRSDLVCSLITSASRECRLQVCNAQTGELVIDAPHRVDIAFSQEDFGW